LDRQALEPGLEMIVMSDTTPTDVIIGVDTHKNIHAVTAISTLGVHLASTTIPANSKGYQALETWATSLGAVRSIGIEGTGSYGAGLSRFLTERGHTVVEFNRANRQLRHQKGKSDAIDAESAARAVLAGQATGKPKSGTSTVEMIRHFKVARDTAVKGRSQAWQCYRILAQECWPNLAHPPSLNLRFSRSDRGAFCGLESQSGIVRAAPSGA
jgi:transposase